MSHCNVSFDDFNLQTKETICSLFESENFADVTIVCNDGDQVPAHKFVLSSSSSLLHKMLTNSSNRLQNRNDFIFLPTVKLKELQPLLQFMYLGQTKIGQDSIETFFRMAADLKINLGSPKEGSNKNQAIEGQSEENNDVFLEPTSISNNQEYQETQNMESLNAEIEEYNTSLEKDENDKSETIECFETMEQNNSETISEGLKENESNVIETIAENSEKLDESDNEEVIGAQNLEETFPGLQYDEEKYKKKIVKKLKGRKFNYPADVDADSTICPICKKAYTTIQGMHRHYQATHEQIRYNCEFCDYQGTQPNSLTLHIKYMHTNQVLKCNECNFETPRDQQLKQHIKKYHRQAYKNFPCTLCDFKAISAGDLKKHIEEKHNGTKFPCDRCSYKASTPGHLAYHSKLHCPYCDQVLFSKRDAHMKIHEEEENCQRPGRGRPKSSHKIILDAR